MARQFLRKISLILGDKTGNGEDLAGLKIVFNVKKADMQTPNSADITVYNPSEDFVKKSKKEFTEIILQAGYEDSFGVIFRGSIIQQWAGRESGLDTFLRILSTDGDAACNFALVNKTIPANSTLSETVNACFDSMSNQSGSLEKGYTDEEALTKLTLPRPQILYGMARDYMRTASQSTNCSWSIQDGKLQMVPLDGYLTSEAVSLTSMTGLVGVPEQTNQGIIIKCLLNPRLSVGGRVKIENSLIKQAMLDTKFGAPNLIPRLDEDGYYKILAVEHTGDSRGQDWYSTLTCVAIDDSAPVGSKLLST